MNLLDIVIIVMMIFLIVRGVFRGFFREIGSLAGIVLGIWLGCRYEPQMTVFLKTYLPSVRFLQLISFTLLFTVVLVLCNFGGWCIKILLKKVLLGWADRTMGAGLAILKGVIITYFIIVLITIFVPSQAPLIARSSLAPFIITSYQSMVSLISPGSYMKWKRKLLGHEKGVNTVISENFQESPVKDGSQ